MEIEYQAGINFNIHFSGMTRWMLDTDLSGFHLKVCTSLRFLMQVFGHSMPLVLSVCLPSCRQPPLALGNKGLNSASQSEEQGQGSSLTRQDSECWRNETSFIIEKMRGPSPGFKDCEWCAVHWEGEMCYRVVDQYRLHTRLCTRMIRGFRYYHLWRPTVFYSTCEAPLWVDYPYLHGSSKTHYSNLNK